VEEGFVVHVEESPAEEEADDGESSDFGAEFVEFEGSGFGGEEAQDAVAIEGREGDQVEDSEEEVEGEEDAQDYGDAFDDSAGAGGFYDIGGGVAAGDEVFEGQAEAHQDGGEDAEGEVGAGSGEGHPGGAFGVLAGPLGVVGGAGPADEAGFRDDSDEGHDDHAEEFAADVGDGVEGDLAAVGRGGVAAEFGDEGVGGFVAGGGEQENDVFEEAEGQIVEIHGARSV